MSQDNKRDSGKSRYITALLALVFGWFGAHKFYLGQMKKGLAFAVFFWTAIPYFIALGQVVHYLVMGDEEFHRRVMGEYDPETTTETETNTPSTTAPDNTETTETDNSGYLRDIPDSGLSHERHNFDVDEILGDDKKYLDNDEEVKYIIEGNSVEIEGGVDKDTTSSSVGTRLKTVVTDKRVIIIIPQRIKGTDTKTIMFDDIVGVDLASGYIMRKLRIQTPARTYDIDIYHEEVAEEAVDYIREMKQKAGGKTQEVTAPEPDPTEQLKNLEDLHESGAISEEEFEEKKSELMKKI